MTDMMAIFCSDGQLHLQEVIKECIPGKWIPMVVIRKPDKPPTLPVFNLEDVAKGFIKRNLPRQWSHGAIVLSDDDVERIKNKGWEIELLDFPRRFTDLPGTTIDFEVHEFAEPPDLKTSRM